MGSGSPEGASEGRVGKIAVWGGSAAVAACHWPCPLFGIRLTHHQAGLQRRLDGPRGWRTATERSLHGHDPSVCQICSWPDLFRHCARAAVSETACAYLSHGTCGHRHRHRHRHTNKPSRPLTDSNPSSKVQLPTQLPTPTATTRSTALIPTGEGCVPHTRLCILQSTYPSLPPLTLSRKAAPPPPATI